MSNSSGILSNRPRGCHIGLTSRRNIFAQSMPLLLRQLLAFAAIPSALIALEAKDAIDFNRDVRPILSDNCYFCHGPDEDERKGDLRLDIREEAIEAYAIVPGDSADSELVLRILHEDPDELMPRPSTNKSLSEEEKDLLVRWIDEGAQYEAHWSYTPIEKRPFPNLDAIVAQELAERNLAFSPEADKRTLIRRVSLDLIGLPPTPDAVEAFLADESPDAYERVVDRLLASPRYGERMAIPWLDAVRYADTVGYHGDQERDATPYRDYVIEAFNTNKSFDQFTIEQLAGDLLPDATLKQRIAASYNRINQISREGGIQDKEYVKKYQAERVRTTATAWLGSTMACCECHDHKFDPFTTQDFYSMAAFFADILEKGAYTPDGSYQEPVEPYLQDPLEHQGWFGPELVVPNETFHPAPHSVREAIRKKSVQLANGSPQAEREFAQWLEQQKVLNERILPSKHSFEFSENEKGERESDLTGYPWPSSELAEISFEVKLITGGGNSVSKMQLAYSYKGETLSKGFYWRDEADQALEEESFRRIGPGFYRGPWSSVSLSRSQLDLPEGAQLLSLKVVNSDGDYGNVQVRSLYQGSENEALSSEGIAALSKVLAESATEEELARLKKEYFLHHAPSLVEQQEAIAALTLELEGVRYTPLTIGAKPREVKILPRGNWMDESGKAVLPATPSFLPNPIASTEDKRLNRLDLAQWIAHPENPLTARAFVNRTWDLYFETPLFNTPEDLGLQGEYPVYPELLDWLAAEFIESGWDVKQLVRTIALSKTYRQTSETIAAAFDVDPQNRLLARQSPVRLSAEIIRDNALQISGLLNTEIGGLSARPYQPKGYYANLNFPKRVYEADTDRSQYRRGVYVHRQRTFLHPMMAAFDAGGRDECTVKRELSNTPLQALNLLNDPTHIEAARAFAQKLLTEARSDKARIKVAYLHALGRPPTAKENRTLQSFLKRERKRFQKEQNEATPYLEIGLAVPDPNDPETELAALTSLCRAVLNLHETITRY